MLDLTWNVGSWQSTSPSRCGEGSELAPWPVGTHPQHPVRISNDTYEMFSFGVPTAGEPGNYHLCWTHASSADASAYLVTESARAHSHVLSKEV